MLRLKLRELTVRTSGQTPISRILRCGLGVPTTQDSGNQLCKPSYRPGSCSGRPLAPAGAGGACPGRPASPPAKCDQPGRWPGGQGRSPGGSPPASIARHQAAGSSTSMLLISLSSASSALRSASLSSSPPPLCSARLGSARLWSSAWPWSEALHSAAPRLRAAAPAPSAERRRMLFVRGPLCRGPPKRKKMARRVYNFV